MNLGPQGPIRPDILESSIYSFMDSVIEGTKKNKPLREILSKSLPDIEGIKQESPIINSNDLEKEIHKNILNLKNSYIVLQGPPGTGKTYQAANAIVKLIQQGKKVGTVKGTAGKPKKGESARMKAKRKSFKARHAKNIAKGKMSAAWWADKVKW